ncbi:hypothetical protein [Gracilibacillus sp. JCM 18860]
MLTKESNYRTELIMAWKFIVNLKEVQQFLQYFLLSILIFQGGG